MSSSNAVGTVSPDEAKKLFNSAGVYESAEQKLTEKSQQQGDVGILSGVVCLVELENGDESFLSVNATLLSLGATISPSFGEHLTHFITSKPSTEDSTKRNKRILAAELLDIFVVSTVWLDQCKCTNQKAKESDFHIQSSLMATARNTEKGLAQNHSIASLHAHQYSDHTEDTSAIRLSRASSHHSITNIEELERVIYDDTDTMLSTIHNTSKATAAATSALSVPMPTFREYIPPVVPQRVLETVAKRRRSERISDLVSDTESGTENKEEDDVSKRQKMESWEYVQDISVDAMLPIVFLPGREGDKLPPFVLHNGSNAYSTTKNGGSGIQGLSANGKKTSSGTGNNGNGTGSGTSKGKAITAGGSTTVAASVKDTSASSKAKDNKDPPVVFKNKVVIAYTGFDDKHGERSTLLQTLRQLIKTIKRRAAEGDVVITPINDTTTIASSEANNKTDTDKSTGEMDITTSNTSNLKNAFNNYNEGNTSSTSVNSLEEKAVSPLAQVKKKVGRPRSVSTNSRDSSSNTAKDKNNANDKSQKKDTSQVVEPTTKHTHSKNNFVASEEEMQGWHIEAFECSVSILTSQSDYSAAACTHVIVNSNSSTRTLRRLFAMARGTCLVTEEWLHSSVSSQSWAPVGLHLHPSCTAMFRNRRDELGAVIKDRAPRADVFRGIKVCVVDSADPPLETLTDLVQAAGAVICYQIGERNVQYAVFGDVSAAFEWTTMMARKKRPWATKVIADVKTLAELGKCVTAKFVFNCIGEGKLREPAESDGELITMDNLMGIMTNEPTKKSNSGSAKKAQQAALTDVTSMEVDEEYYFMDTSATTASASASVNNLTGVNASGSASKDNIRRSRHSLCADPEAIVDLTAIDNPAPGICSDPTSGKKKTIAEERLQRQLSNEFLPAKSRSSKKTTNDVHNESAGDKITPSVSATTTTVQCTQ